PGDRKEASMSDFDRNYSAVRGFGADRAVAIDQGLRAHMIRVYNYMAAGVALTGVIAWLAYQAAGGDAIVRSGGRGVRRVDAVRPGHLPGPVGAGSPFRSDRPWAFPDLADRAPAGEHRAAPVLRLRGPIRTRPLGHLSGLHPRVAHPRVLHLGRLVRRAV